MPKFIPKAKEENKPVEPAREEPKPQPAQEDVEKLKELERKFGKLGSPEPETKGEKTSEDSVERSLHQGIVEHEVIRRAKPPEGMISRDDAEYISKDTAEKRKRELAMAEARLRSLEREEQEINKRLEYLRKEHSAMELAIKEKTHLEREIAELREDRDRIKIKLDEFKALEGQLEQKTWEELKRSPAIGAKISALERRINELEGQIIELNEQRLRTGGTSVARPRPQPRTQPKAEPKTEEKPVPSELTKPGEEKKEPPTVDKKKKTRLTF